MKRRMSLARNDKSAKMLAKWSIFIILISGWLGVSYAAFTNAMYADFDINTSNMSFIFDHGKGKWYSTDVMLQIGDKTPKHLGGTITYKDKIMTIKGIGPIEYKDFETGNVTITINYEIKPDESSGILKPATVKEGDLGYELGSFEFERHPDSMVWDSQLGILGGSSNDFSEYLPDDLGEFEAFNLITEHKNKDGIMAGTLTLKQTREPDIDSIDIGVSSMVSQDITSNDTKKVQDTLNIKATYSFTIPLNLDQFNVERDRY